MKPLDPRSPAHPAILFARTVAEPVERRRRLACAFDLLLEIAERAAPEMACVDARPGETAERKDSRHAE